MTANDDTAVDLKFQKDGLEGSMRSKETYSQGAAERLPSYDVIIVETPAYESLAVITDANDVFSRPDVYVNGELDCTLDPLGLADELVGEAIERDNPHPREVGEKYGVDWSGVADTTRGNLDRLIASAESGSTGRLPLRSRKKKDLVIYENGGDSGPWTKGRYTILRGKKGEEYIFARVRGMSSRQSAESLVMDVHEYVRGKRDKIIIKGSYEEFMKVRDGSYFLDRKRKREAAEKPRAPIPEAQPVQRPAPKAGQKYTRRRTWSEARARDITMEERLAAGSGTFGRELTERERKLLFDNGIPGDSAGESDRSDSDVVRLGENTEERKRDYLGFMGRFVPKKEDGQ